MRPSARDWMAVGLLTIVLVLLIVGLVAMGAPGAAPHALRGLGFG